MYKAAAWLLVSLFYCASCYKATVVIGEVAQRDTNRPIYEIHFPQVGDYETSFNPPDDEVPKGMKAMRMVTARGQAMRCLLPELEPSSSPDDDDEEISEETRFDDIDTLLKEYENKCFVRWEGWWTYEFCYGQHVVQKHIIPKDRDPFDGEIEDTFVLGRYNREMDLTRRKNSTLVSTSDSPFTQMFDNGTVCDMTGQARRVLVKYVCCDDAVQFGNAAVPGQGKLASEQANFINILKAVREVESCVYEVEFMNSAICRHSSYKEKLARAARPIHCSVVHGEGAFQGLKAAKYHRASLSL